MPAYRTFTCEDALKYARHYGGIADADTLVSAQEIGDGNLNLVFSIRDNHGQRRLIVKQALPYVRSIGESWPLTLDRARIEAQTLIAHGQYCPQHTVNILYHDPGLAVMIQEDLSDHRIWRQELIKGLDYPQAPEQLAEYLAQVLFHYSDFYQLPHDKKAAVCRFTNPELCQITEDLFFTDPYNAHPRNQFDPALQTDVLALQHHDELKRAVAGLKHQFLTRTESLLHGDLHSGSVFVASGRVKVIDAEFGFYGPLGFDLGTVIGNLLLNYCALPGLLDSEWATQQQQRRLANIALFWQTFANQFIVLSEQQGRDPALAQEGYVQQFIQQVWRDTLGFAGTELIRRTIGLSHVIDLESISDKSARISCQRHAINLGSSLILNAHRLTDVRALVLHIQSRSFQQTPQPLTSLA
jgi:5-methylthioribose kinase